MADNPTPQDAVKALRESLAEIAIEYSGFAVGANNLRTQQLWTRAQELITLINALEEPLALSYIEPIRYMDATTPYPGFVPGTSIS